MAHKDAIMHSSTRISTTALLVLAAAAAISFFDFVSDAFTPPLQINHFSEKSSHSLYGKKRKGSFLDEFPEEDPTKSQNQPTKQQPDNFHSDLISWLTKHPLTYINPKFKISPSSLGGYGGFNSPQDVPMKPNEMILCIPRELCITFDDALNDQACGGAFGMMKEYGMPDWPLLLIAGWAAKEYLMGNIIAEKLKSRGVGERKINAAKAKIKHWYYLKTIPWKRGELDQEHVLFWTDDEVETLLKDSFAHKDAKLIRSRTHNATKLLDSLAIGPVLRKELGLNASEPVEGLKEAVTAAYVSLLSRSFAEEVEVDNPDGTTSIEQETLLIPLLDILQHSNEPNTIVETYDNYIILKAARTILPGEEIFHRYQEENDDIIPPYKFFTRYGFVPGVRTPVVKLLEEKSPLFFDEDWYSQFYGS